MNVTEEMRAVARVTASVFQSKSPPITRYWDDRKSNCVYILTASETPMPGVTSVATIGLSEHDIGLVVKDKPLRVELVGATAANFPALPNVIATCALKIINEDMPVPQV